MVSVLEQCVEVIEGVRSLKDMYPHQLNESQGDVVECERPLWLKDEGGRILEEAVHKLEVSVYTYVGYGCVYPLFLLILLLTSAVFNTWCKVCFD